MDITDIEKAQHRIRPRIKRTPLEYNETLSRRLGANIFVKYEMFQKTGAFKVRGAFNKLLLMSKAELERGVVAVSGGNHAQAVAYASSVLSVDSMIVMPESTPKSYVDATRGYGSSIVLRPTIAECFEEVKRFQEKGRVFLHPFDDPQIMAGAGTVGLEIMQELGEATDVVVSIGGGGLAGGVATAVKSLKPAVRVWGVETEGADAMSQALGAGKPVTLPAITSIAKTLGAPYVSEVTLQLAQRYLEGVTVVTDREAVAELEFIAERLKVITEPAASCTLAAAERLKNNFDGKSNVVLILCGGNTSVSDICGFRSLLNS